MIYCKLRGKKCRSLTCVAEKWYVALQPFAQIWTKARRDYEIARKGKLALDRENFVKIGGEKQRFGELRPQRPQDQQFVKHIAAKDTDRFYFLFLSFFMRLFPEVVVDLMELRADPPQIIVLALSNRTLKALSIVFDLEKIWRAARFCSRSCGFLLLRVLLARARRQKAIETPEIGEFVNRDWIIGSECALDCLRECLAVKRVPFRDQRDMIRSRVDPSKRKFVTNTIGQRVFGRYCSLQMNPTLLEKVLK